MMRIKKAIAAIMLMTAVIFAAGCTKNDDLNNGGTNGGGNGTLSVTTNDVSGITASSATCGGSVTAEGDMTVTAKGVCYGTSRNPSIEDTHTSDGQGVGSFTSNLVGLTASTKYYVRAYAQSGSEVIYGEEKSFTTGEQPQAPTVMVTLINVTPTYLELKFEPSNNTSYYCYNIGGTLTSSSHVTGVKTKKFTNLQSQKLQPDTEYEFSVVAYDANGIAGEIIHPKFKTSPAPYANYYRIFDNFYELSYAKLVNEPTANPYMRSKEIQFWSEPGYWVRFLTIVNWTETDNNWYSGVYTTGGDYNSVGYCFCTFYKNGSSSDTGDGSTLTISKSGNMWIYDYYGERGAYTAHFVGIPTY